MAYSQQSDILNVLPTQWLMQLTDDTNSGEINSDTVNACIATADAVIDGYLESRYEQVPLPTPYPALVIQISRDLAVYEIYSRRSAGGIPENIRSRATDATNKLVQIAKGIISLGIEATSELGVFKGNPTPRRRVFGNHNLPLGIPEAQYP